MSLYVRLNAEYASDDEFIEAGPLPELLYIRSLCFCKRKLIDGTISVKQLPVVASGIPSAKKHARTLVEVGLWEEIDDGWSIVGWLKWNKSSEQVEEDREARRLASQKANHAQYHIGQGGKPSTRCDICKEEGLVDVPKSAPKSEPPTEPDSVRSRLRKPKPEPEEEPKPEPEPQEKPSVGSDSSSSKVTPPTETTKRSKIIDTVVDIRANGQAKGPKWRETVAADVEARHGAKIDQWLNKFPDAPVDALASALESGDSRGLAYFTYQHRPPPEPERRLSAEERAALMADAGAPEKFTRPRTEEA